MIYFFVYTERTAGKATVNGARAFADGIVGVLAMKQRGRDEGEEKEDESRP